MRMTTATTISLYAISALAAPPIQRRDEWQPFTSTIPFPEGATVPAPTDHPNTSWQPEGNQTCLYITSDYGWKGYGLNLCQTAGVCSDRLPDGLSGKVLSVGPSSAQVCFLYGSEFCTGLISKPIVHPGYSNLKEISFENAAKSWKCYKMYPPEDPEAPMTTTSIATVASTTTVTEPVIISSTRSAVVPTTTMPGGLPVSQQISSPQAPSMRTVTVVPIQISITKPVQSTSASGSLAPAGMESPPVLTNVSGRVLCSAAVWHTTVSLNDRPGSTVVLTTSAFPQPSWCADTTSGTTTAEFTTTSSASSFFVFRPDPTIVTHTFAGGRVATTTL